jgi:8-oxo-dGTP pyrophosphatase MutT (NUDIX family)
MKSNYKFVIKWKDNFYDCEWFDDTNFEKLSEVQGVHAFIFNDKNEICIAKWKKDKYWGDVGGKKEKFDKTFEDTLIREADEEVDLDLKDIKRVGYYSSIKRGTNDVKYSTMFIARVKKIKNQTIDPAYGEIPKRKFVKPEDFNKYCNWGENGEFQIKKALDKLKG